MDCAAQYEKADSLIDVTLSGNTTLSKYAHDANALRSTVDTPSGTTTVPR